MAYVFFPHDTCECARGSYILITSPEGRSRLVVNPTGSAKMESHRDTIDLVDVVNRKTMWFS